VIGISIKPTIGIGDALQFSSLPENYFKATGHQLYDVNRHWFFDHNPFVCRDPNVKPNKIREMWNFSPTQFEWPKVRPQGVYLCNAEIWAAALGVKKLVLNRPRLYRFEEFPYAKREKILLHIDGRSHGKMPDYIIDHIIKKYGPTNQLYQIGTMHKLEGIQVIETPTLWDLAQTISESRMLIGMDSGPSWIAACYPDVIVKKLRTKPTPNYFHDWVPLETGNIHSHWDDRCHQIFNPTEEDIGFTSSYRKI